MSSRRLIARATSPSNGESDLDADRVPDEMVPLVAHEVRAMLQGATIVGVRHLVSLRDDVDRIELALERDGEPIGTARISSRPHRCPLILRHSNEAS